MPISNARIDALLYDVLQYHDENEEEWWRDSLGSEWAQDPDAVTMQALAASLLYPALEADEVSDAAFAFETFTETLKRHAAFPTDEDPEQEEVKSWMEGVLGDASGWYHLGSGQTDGLTWSIWSLPYSELPSVLIVRDDKTGETGIGLEYEWCD